MSERKLLVAVGQPDINWMEINCISMMKVVPVRQRPVVLLAGIVSIRLIDTNEGFLAYFMSRVD